MSSPIEDDVADALAASSRAVRTSQQTRAELLQLSARTLQTAHQAELDALRARFLAQLAAGIAGAALACSLAAMLLAGYVYGLLPLEPPAPRLEPAVSRPRKP